MLAQTTLGGTAAQQAAAQQADTLQAWGRTGMDSIMAGDGIMIAIVGVIIVFVSLTIISLLIRLLKVLASQKKERGTEAEAATPVRNGVSGEVVAAIATALQHHLFELHDEERTIITIKKVSRPYSPWSSKLYGMTPSPFTTVSKR
ncbi:MAG: OadG family protein [Bacteroidota bacterium]|nr:OadG family protein [Bacteroidota bacterium]